LTDTSSPQLEPLSPELMRELEAALDSTNCDPEQATLQIVGRLRRDDRGRPADPHLSALWDGVSWVSDVQHPETRMALMLTVMRQIQRKRERAQSTTQDIFSRRPV